METQTIFVVLLVVMVVFAGFQSLQLINLKNAIEENGVTSLATSSPSSGSEILAEASEIPEQVGGCFR